VALDHAEHLDVTCQVEGVRVALTVVTRAISIHWDDLESAFERNAPDTESFLDLQTGQVVTILAGDPEAAMLKQKVAAQIQHHTRVEPASSREQYRWMERFVGSVTDPALRERLVMAIDGKGAFRRFKDVLLAFPAERERWFSYRAELLHWHMHNWLKERGIEPTAPPPWGEAKQPVELGEAPIRPVPHGVEPPGEALRRQARELIDGLPAIDLPSAIAFLEFLKDRAAQAMGRSDRRGDREPGGASVSADLDDLGDDESGDDDDSDRDDDDTESSPARTIRPAIVS
jgi:hypothetical protein